MNTSAFNHKLDSVYEAVGFTEDQYDEIIFKTMQYIKRMSSESTQSEIMAACVKWAFEHFEDDALRGMACIFMGKTIEKAMMMSGIEDMLSSGKSGLLAKLKALQSMKGGAIASDSIAFNDDQNRDGFMKEFKELIAEFGGQEEENFGGHDGVVAVALDPARKDEFHDRLNALKSKYGVLSEDDDMGKMMPFGGPVTQA